MALTFTVRANDVYSDTPDFGTYRGVAIGGHLAAGVSVALAAASLVLYFRASSTPRGDLVAGGLSTPAGFRF